MSSNKPFRRPLTKADIEWFDGIGAGPPPSCRALEESTQAVDRPMSGLFNNLVIHKQDVPQNSMKSIVPELPTRWSWNEDTVNGPDGSSKAVAGRDHVRMRTRAFPANLISIAGAAGRMGEIRPTRCWREPDSNLYGAFPVKWSFGLLAGSLFGAGKSFFVPSPAIRFAERAEGVKGPKR